MKTLAARQEDEIDGKVRLTCPAVGSFLSRHEHGEALEAGAVLGILSVLNRRYAVCVPEGKWGVVIQSIGSGTHHVEYGSALVTLDTSATGSADRSPEENRQIAEADAADEELIRSPIDGIFYCRPEPGTEPFVAVGDPIRPGQVVGLVEVMKTFNPIRWQPDSETGAVVLRLEAQDQQEVSAGQILLVLGRSG